MARSVADAALLLNVISAPDARDYTALPPDPHDHRDGLDAGVRGLRIGLLEDIGFGTAVDPQVRAALHATARLIEGLGAVVEPLPPPFADDPEPVFDQLLHMRTYTMFAAMSPAQRASMGPALASWCGQEVQGSRLQLMQALVAVGEIRRRTLAPFQHHDFMLAPVMADLPFEAERPWAPGPSPHNPFCFPFNMSEQPAASVHGGFSREGWPIGLQIIGRRFDDRGVLRVAQACDAASGHLARAAAAGPASR
jgi:Asp-tRNA(Asn)/Glu-tRNA(Gln) amidotransferase A subunit family amidase